MLYWLIILILSLVVLGCLYLLWKAKGELQEMKRGDRMKCTFMNNISQEVRESVKSIKAMADTVSNEDLFLSKNEKRDLADQMRYNSNLIGTLVDEMLLFVEADNEGHQLKDDLFSPNALCRRCLEANYHSIYHQQAVKLNFKRELSDEYFLKTDRHMVEVILNKLIQNSCRFTEEGSITVGCNTSERIGQILFFVKDTGRGIPQSRMNNLFSWFEEPDEMKDMAELDLSICQKLAQKLGGVLQLDPMFQKGTRMLLILPLKK